MKKFISLILTAAIAAAVAVSGSISADAAEASRYIKGDVNGDKNITLRDATYVQKYVVNSITPEAKIKYAADIDSSGRLELADAYAIQKLVCCDSDTMKAYAPNKVSRMKFMKALNAERKSKGMSEIKYNDTMFGIGQILAEKWYAEFFDDATEFSGRAVDPFDNKTYGYSSFPALYGITSASGTSKINASSGGAYDGDSYYSEFKADTNGAIIYNNILMNANTTAVFIGEVGLYENGTNRAATGGIWVIYAY